MANSSPTTNASTTPSAPEHSPHGFANTAYPSGSLRENLMRKWAGLKLADYGLQLEKDGRRQQIVERLIRKTQDGTLGRPTNEPWPDEEMAVSVGDTTNHHYHTPPRGNSLGKLAIAAGLLATGVAVPFVLNALRDPPPAVSTDDRPDSDTQYGLRLFHEDQ